MTSPAFRRSSLAVLASLAVVCASCASVDFRRSTQTSGTFTSRGWSFTILSVDIPKTAEQIARENASDANQPNMQVSDVFVFPYLGPVDWILDILSIRYCRIDGTWGFPGAAEEGRGASR